jgi:hypothetical protein
MSLTLQVKIPLFLTIIPLMIFPPTLGISFGENDEPIFIPKSQQPPQIDGKWTSKTEWLDASETKIADEKLTAYLRMKHDGIFVYVLIDFISDRGLEKSGDFAVVCFDTKNNAGNAPLPDDYCFYRVTRTGDFIDGIIQGNGTEWTVLQEAETWDPYDEKFNAAILFSHMHDPYDSINNHVIYEFRIPIESYGFNEEMGFYVYVNDAYTNEFIEWPTNAGGKQFKLIVKDVVPVPNQWGNLHLQLDKENDLAGPQVQLEENVKVEVSVQAKQIKDLIIVRLRNMDDSTVDVQAFKMLVHDSLLKAAKGPSEWIKEGRHANEVAFSTLTKPISAGDKGYFLLKVEGTKPLITWTVYGPDHGETAEDSVVPFLR